MKQNLLTTHYLKENEGFMEGLRRACKAYSGGDRELENRLFSYVEKGWFMFSSPMLSNAPGEGETWGKGLPIACFGGYVADTIEGLCEHTTETRYMSIAGGGVGGYWGDVRFNDQKSPGPIPFLHTIDADMIAYHQGRTRRGAYCATLDIHHPDIEEFINIRTPTGDENRKCFNIHHSVNITGKFLDAVEDNEDFDLVCPKTKAIIKTLKARYLWERILETRSRTGEPYIHYVDESNDKLPKSLKDHGKRVHHSNLCVAPETEVLTDIGHIPIKNLEGESVNIWNGEEWSKVIVNKTGKNQKLIEVVTSSGKTIECTPYHKFYIVKDYNGKVYEVRAGELSPGDKLIKFNIPVIEGSSILNDSYIKGFYTGDGCKTEKFFVPGTNYTIQSRLEWLAGWLDADGCVHRHGDNDQLLGASGEREFLIDVQLMLMTLGVDAKVSNHLYFLNPFPNPLRDEGYYDLPLNDGTGENQPYHCKEAWRLLITSCDVYHLLELGLKLRRLEVTKRKPQRDDRKFNTVISVTDTGRVDDTYCFTEHKRGMGVFNGVLTGQCHEITLPTSKDESFVCCLSSVNLALFDAWKNTRMVEDLVVMLDNGLDVFIENAPPELSRAVKTAREQRAIGLGAMGFHSYLQKNLIPFESLEASDINEEMFYNIYSQAKASSHNIAKRKGAYPFCTDSAIRNALLIAIAPNANSSLLLGVSPGIEPNISNYYSQSTRAGVNVVKNRYLIPVLEKHGINTEETWKSIASNNGSVQHLAALTDDEKEVFKTAFEIDQHTIIELARVRQLYICQAQSVNLFFPSGCERSYVNSVHRMAFTDDNLVEGTPLKTLYYLRTQSSSQTEYVSNKIECVGCD